MTRLSDFWDERYSGSDYVYGEDPNSYLKDKLKNFPVGSILFVGEGEGRNAVYAAKLGWEVSAFDISSEGKKKAKKLARKNDVHIDYQIGELDELDYKKEQFDVIALIYTHFPGDTRSNIHKTLSNYLRQGGTIILEAFSKNQISHQAKNQSVGGPKDINNLYTPEDIKSDFETFEIIELIETEIYLTEGFYHNGLSSVIRFMARKRISVNDVL